MEDKILVIDNGSYKCRVGFNDSHVPQLEFRNLVAKPRKDKRKDATAIVNENAFQIGDEIDIDAMRLLLKNQFERNVVTHPIYQEHIFDYIFGRISKGGSDWEPHPILITEPLGNPSYSRQSINELLFECYGVPGVCYGIDSVFSWQKNKICNQDNGLVLNFGYHTTHVSPILNGKLQLNKIRRMNLGGYEMIWYIYRLLQMKYPAHLNGITWTRVEEIFHKYSYVAMDYREELAKWENLDYYNETVKKIQLPYIQPQVVNPILTEEKIKRRKEITKRLIEANQKRLQKKGEEASTTNTASTSSNRSSKYKPPKDIPLEQWLNDIKRKHSVIMENKMNRNKRRQDMAKRHTLASQERMRIISLLASNEKGSDEFGKDDNDWDVYKKISTENESDSDAENEKLMEYEGVLKKYNQTAMDKLPAENTAELYQLHVGVENVRAPELLFQPSMIGMGECGIAELLNFVFKTFTPENQQTLANNIYLTGGCCQLPGLKTRLERELQEMRPFQTKWNVIVANDPLLDAWSGAKDFSNTPDFANKLTTKKDYEEFGPEYFRDNDLSNKYYCTPRNI